MPWPYHSEPTHDRGTWTEDSNNASRDTAVSNAESRLVLDMAADIFIIQPKVNPFTTVLTNWGRQSLDGKTYKGVGLRTRTVHQPRFDELSDYEGGRVCQVSGTYSASGNVTITVKGAGSSSANIFTVGDVVLNVRTGERFKIATVASTTTVTVLATERGIGSSSLAAGADGDDLVIIGNASEEGSGARNVNSTRAVDGYNYTQIFKKTFAVTGTEDVSMLYGGPDLPFQRMKKGLEHAKDIEFALLFGTRDSLTTGTQGKPMRFTGGVDEFIESNSAYIQDQNGQPLTRADLDVFLREGFSYGENNKIFMVGANLLSAITEIAQGQLRTVQGVNTYGLAINRWISPHGEIDIVHNPLFAGPFVDRGYLLDMDSFKYAYLMGPRGSRDTMLRMDIGANDVDGQVDEFLTECGIERRGAPRNALLKGVV